MSNPKHTPGPWTVSTHFKTTDEWSVESAEMGPNGRHVAVANGHGNARLIAAAPEMLSDLQYAIEEFSLSGCTKREDFEHLISELQIRFKKTVAKATGVRR